MDSGVESGAGSTAGVDSTLKEIVVITISYNSTYVLLYGTIDSKGHGDDLSKAVAR